MAGSVIATFSGAYWLVAMIVRGDSQRSACRMHGEVLVLFTQRHACRQINGTVALVFVRKALRTLGATDEVVRYSTTELLSQTHHILPMQMIDGHFQYVASTRPCQKLQQLKVGVPNVKRRCPERLKVGVPNAQR